LEATRQFRRTEGEGRRTTIIATTADALAGTREICIQSGMDDYISKPIDIKKLAEILERYGGSPVADDESEPVVGEEPQESSGGAPVQISRLQVIARGDLGFERRIITLYLDECEKRMAGIDHALEGADVEGLRGEAHTLKGSSGNIGADRVSEWAGRLQKAAEDNDRDRWPEIYEALKAECESTNRWLEGYILNLESREEGHNDE
jgi:two-component system sensor histidine kinase/response regulator